MTKHEYSLSSEGEQRRVRILEQSQHEMRDFHVRRRRRRKLTGICATTAVCCLLGSVVLRSHSKVAQDISPTVSEREDVGLKIEPAYSKYLVFTEPRMHERYLIRNSDIDVRRIEAISDSDLLAVFAEHGSDGFLATIGTDRIFIATSAPGQASR